MMATKQSYAAEEAAGRVLPCVAPLAVDAVPEVRHAALATLEAFVKLLQEHSATRDSAAGSSDAAGGAQQVQSCMMPLPFLQCMYGCNPALIRSCFPPGLLVADPQQIQVL